MRHFIFLLLLFLSLSCADENKKTHNPKPVQNINTELEANLVVNSSFKVGDVRRYGIEIGKGDKTHPYSKKSTIASIIEMASKTNTELIFPKGFYDLSLIFKGIKNVNIKANEAEFSGPIYFIEDEEKNHTSDIKIKGTITTYYKVFMRQSQDIEIENLIISNNKEKNSSKLESMGCDIYSGVNFVYIKNLIIEGIGDSDKYHPLTRAALQIHGWNNNPQEVVIDNIELNSKRHGIYLTGKNNTINKIKINSFGTGNTNGMIDLEDSDKGESINVTGIWVNRCSNCTIGSVTINTKNSKGKYSVWLDEGNLGEPTTIEKITIIGGDDKLPIYASEITNSVIRKVEKI